VGVPLSRPVQALNEAHAGLLLIEKRSHVRRSGSDALGVKVYAVPAATLVGGDPEITGGRLAAAACVAAALNDKPATSASRP
jgi:hypothetical protein